MNKLALYYDKSGYDPKLRSKHIYGKTGNPHYVYTLVGIEENGLADFIEWENLAKKHSSTPTNTEYKSRANLLLYNKSRLWVLSYCLLMKIITLLLLPLTNV